MSESELIARLREKVVTRHGAKAADVRVVRAPYRICPLGAHIDHQLGPVTAMALDRGALLAYAPSTAREVRLSSTSFRGEVAFALDDVPDRRESDWGNYARGAVRALAQKRPLRTGLVGVTAGSLSGGGLSSSAAIGVAYLLALEDVNGLEVSREENVRLDQYIENRYLGLRNGVLDQSAILFSRRGCLTLIDCATLKHELIARAESMPDFAILIASSGMQKALVGTDYNRRVAECAEAARVLLEAAGRPEAEPLLGHVAAEEYAAHKSRLESAPARRAEHFFSEVDRVRRGVAAWRRGDLEAFGSLITASGESSIRHYECGSPPLIDLHRILVETEGVYGARFSGAGFRGCCLALVKPEAASQGAASVRRAYHARHPELAANARVFLCRSDDGARIL